MNDTEAAVLRLFESWSGRSSDSLLSLGANGSNRRYWRLSYGGRSCIAAFNDKVRENEAFFYFARQLALRGVRVPEVYSISPDRRFYLQQDLGDTTLFSLLFEKQRNGSGFDSEMVALYRRALDDLAFMQVAGRNLDFSMAYPRPAFDARSIHWDLNYFKYFFLKLRHVPFDEDLLEDDFNRLTDYLLDAEDEFFMYRDFQSRNIMLSQHELFYIDFQGGRRGAAQYDAASLLYSSKSRLSEAVRQDLLDHYVRCLGSRFAVNPAQFKARYYAFVLTRIMQAMGAYGYRGYFERKDSFLQSIPPAVRNLKSVIDSHPLDIRLPQLEEVWRRIADAEEAAAPTRPAGLTVTVTSFSYKKGLPHDNSGNGGGFIFDCRALPNPGRCPQYRCYTGKDRPVIDFLRPDPEVEAFLLSAQRLVDASVEKYLARNFTSLAVAFGCTGGQHRSVYCAEQTAAWIRKHYDCQVIIQHREQDC